MLIIKTLHLASIVKDSEGNNSCLSEYQGSLSDMSAMSVTHCAFMCQHTTGCRAILYKTSGTVH